MSKDSQESIKAPIGRPTRYTKEFPEMLLEYFDRDLDKVVSTEVATNKGVQIINEVKPNRLPTVEGFCKEHKLSKRTFHDYVKKYPEFAHALGRAKQMQMEHLIQHTLEGSYNAGFAKFLAMNISDYKEKFETQNEHEFSIKIESQDEQL